ncbi:MAG: histidine phosphatase family protein [Pseudomonadota bacterium]
MAVELWLVRHGQAAFATGDYDRLTALGWDQARWLGEHLATRGLTFDRIVAGTLRRQQETAEALAGQIGGSVETVPGLEEYNPADILLAHGSAPHQTEDRRGHFRALRAALIAWSEGRLDGVAEPFDAFAARIQAAIADLTNVCQGRILAATSGGVIGYVVGTALGANGARMVDLNLQARNSSVTRLIVTRQAMILNMFNAIPHLEHPDRASAETYS